MKRNLLINWILGIVLVLWISMSNLIAGEIYKIQNDAYSTKKNTPSLSSNAGDSTLLQYEFFAIPNPFENELLIRVNPGNKILREIKIFDLIGKEVTTIDISHRSGVLTYRVDFTHLRAGVYFCNIYSDKGLVESRKLFSTK